MKKRTAIILRKGERLEVWANLAELCRCYQWPYGTLKARKFPFEYKGFQLNKYKFKTYKKNETVVKGDQ